MLKSFSKYSSGAHVVNPITKESTCTKVVGYIDDNNLIQTFKEECGHTIQLQTRIAFKEWQGLLESTGGALNQDTTQIYAWKWIWKDGLPVMKDIPITVEAEGKEIEYASNQQKAYH